MRLPQLYSANFRGIKIRKISQVYWVNLLRAIINGFKDAEV